MFEITADAIAALNDADLRTLVGRLCDAELWQRNLAVWAVTRAAISSILPAPAEGRTTSIGLDLFIAGPIAVAHGGTITVSSTENPGPPSGATARSAHCLIQAVLSGATFGSTPKPCPKKTRRSPHRLADHRRSTRCASLPHVCSMRLIAVTGDAQESDRRRTRQAGCHHHLVKPVDLLSSTTFLPGPRSENLTRKKRDPGSVQRG
jgi:hypothetical protein